MRARLGRQISTCSREYRCDIALSQTVQVICGENGLGREREHNANSAPCQLRDSSAFPRPLVTAQAERVPGLETQVLRSMARTEHKLRHALVTCGREDDKALVIHSSLLSDPARLLSRRLRAAKERRWRRTGNIALCLLTITSQSWKWLGAQ